MTIPRPPQSWQVINEDALNALETQVREPLDNLLNILNSKIDHPFRISTSGNILTVHSSEARTLKSDGSSGSIDSFIYATAPIQRQYKKFDDSTINVTTGAVTGDFIPSPSSPSMTPNNYIWLGMEANSSGIIMLAWGVESPTASGTTYPNFGSGTALAMVLLQDDGSGGSWNFLPPTTDNIVVFKGSGGGGGGAGGLGNSHLLSVHEKTLNFDAGTLTWSEDINIVNPFIGSYKITAGSLGSIVANDILYSKIYLPQKAAGNGSISGTINLTDTSDFNDNDTVIIGDADSVQVSGYVFGTPTPSVLTVDDGLGTPIDLSAFTVAQGAWVIRTNISLSNAQINTGDLKPDDTGNYPENIYIVGMRIGEYVHLVNGMILGPTWFYEESLYSSAGYSPDDVVNLPLDTKNGNETRYYKNGNGELSIYLNGVLLEKDRVSLVASTFTPISYTPGTGVLRVTDGVDLSGVMRGCTFIDSASNTFTILGDIDNTPGNKQFKLNTSLTVGLGAGAYIFYQDYAESGSIGSLTNQIVIKNFIDTRSILKFKISSNIKK